ASPLRGGDRAVRAPDAARGEQRGGAAPARVALRRRPLRDRPLRALAVPRRPVRRPARARPVVAQRARAGAAAAPRRVHRLRPALRRGARDVDRRCAGRLRRRPAPRPHRRRGARRRRAAPPRGHRVDGRRRGRAAPRAPGGGPGDDRRRRPHARGACARRRDDHVRARLLDRARRRGGARPAAGGRVVSHVERRVELQRRRAGALAARLDDLLPLTGRERVLDVGAGAGALAFAVAPRAASVVAVERDEELAARARADAPPNCEVVVADGEHLPFDDFSFDVGATLRTLHHTPRPEILVADLVAPADPLAAFELTRFEHARDPSTTRVLSDADLRGLFDANNLVLRREVVDRERRDLDDYLDLAGCEGAERERARSLAPSGYEAVVAWYVLAR